MWNNLSSKTEWQQTKLRELNKVPLTSKVTCFKTRIKRLATLETAEMTNDVYFEVPVVGPCSLFSTFCFRYFTNIHLFQHKKSQNRTAD